MAAGRRRGVKSVEVGLRVIEALVELGGAATLTAVAKAAGMPAPQAHRYLFSLIAAGMAQQDAGTGLYDLGPAALRLGLGALARVDAVRITDGAVMAFAHRTSRTIQIAALGPMGPTIIRWAAGRPPVMTSFTIGSVLPLLGSATGQIFLAFLPPSETEHLLEVELARGDATRAEAEHLRATVRATGHAYVDGTMVPGLRATAFPIFDAQGRAVLTATVLSVDRGNGRSVDETTRELAELCSQLSEQLGYRAPVGASA